MPDSIVQAGSKIDQKATQLLAKGFNVGPKIGAIQDAGWGGWFQAFQNCRIYSHHAVGTYEVHGGILSKFLSRTGVGVFRPNGRRELGFPKSDEEKTPELYPVSRFEWGEIIFFPSTDGGVSISGEIFKAWKAGQFVRYGYPLISNTRKNNFEFVFFERGLAVQMINSTEVLWFEAKYPLMGNPAVFNIYDNTPPIYFSFSQNILDKIGNQSLFFQIIIDHLVLEQVGNPNSVINLNVRSIETLRPFGQNAIYHLMVGSNVKKPMVTQEKAPTLYNLVVKNENGGTSMMAPHCLYHRISWDNFGLLHATDIHVARRNDHIVKILKEKLQTFPTNTRDAQSGIENFNNWNNGFRDFIRYANSMYKMGIVDGILATGDLVDYLFEAGELKTAGGNFKLFRDLILGYSPYPESGMRAEELLVPIFVTLGNHDYRVNPYEIYQRINIRGYVIPIPDEDVEQFNGFNLTKDEARVIQGGNPDKFGDDDEGRLKISSDTAKNQVIPCTQLSHWGTDHLSYFKRCIGKEESYIVRLGGNKIIMLNSGPDLGAPDGSWDTWDAVTTALGFGSTDEVAFQKMGSPNSRGPLDSDISLLAHLNADDKTVIIGIHAPPINVFNNDYGHYLRETESTWNFDRDIAAFLLRCLHSEGTDWYNLTMKYGGPIQLNVPIVKNDFPTWFNNGPSFKVGSPLEYLHGGVSRGKILDLLKLLVGQNSGGKAADLMLTGHDHCMSEIRFKWDRVANQMQYFTDFYTENPDRYQNSKSNNGDVAYDYPVKIKVRQGGNPTLEKEEFEARTKIKVLEVPPYANTLNQAADKKEWWNTHRPLQVQGAPLGPTDHNNRTKKDYTPSQPSFEGCKMIIVRNNVIDSIIQVPRLAMAQEVHTPPPGISGVSFGVTHFGRFKATTTFGINR